MDEEEIDDDEVTPSGSGSVGNLTPARGSGPSNRGTRPGGMGNRGDVGSRPGGRGRARGQGGRGQQARGRGGRPRERRRGGRAAEARERLRDELGRWGPLDQESAFPVREFGGPTPGYSGRFEVESRPIDFFNIFFNQLFLQMIVTQTNLYYTQTKPDVPFVELTVRELTAFFGLTIIISTVGIRVLELIWSTRPLFRHPVWADVMTKRRFFWIMRYFHFNDNTQPADIQNQDKLYKLRPVIDHFKRVCPHNYNLSRDISADEAMVKFKGQHSARQHDASKPIKRGFKIWTLADAVTGYVYNLNVYLGKFGDGANTKHLGMKAVKALITPDLHGLHHRLYCDRYFTSLQLLKDLKEIGIYCCGTIMSNRWAFPPDIKDLKAREKQIQRGETHFARHDEGMTAYAWKDKKLVFVLSSAHSPDLPLTTVKRTINVRRVRKDVPCPQAVADYNKYMGGVDHADQLKCYYSVERKSRRWYMRLFWHFFDTMITNAFIIHKEWELNNPANNGKFTRLLKFRHNLAEQLIGDFTSRRRLGRRPVAAHQRMNPAHDHVLVNLRPAKKRRCVVCTGNDERHETYFGCAQCNNTPLCNSVARQCFDKFHNPQD